MISNKADLDKTSVTLPEEDSTTPSYATQVEMKKGDPLSNKGDNDLFYSTETIGSEEVPLFGKRRNKKRDMKKNPITDEERAEYKQKYLEQYGGGAARKMAEDDYNSKSAKDIDRDIENNSNRMIHDTNKSKWDQDVLKYVDTLQDKANGDSIATDDFISELKNSPEWSLYGSDQIVQQIRDKTKKYNDSVKESGYNKTKEDIADVKQTIKDTSASTNKAVENTAKETQNKVDTTAKETQDTVKSESKDIQDKIEDIRDDVIKNATGLKNFYTNYPDLEEYNKDSEYNEAKQNTNAAYKALIDAENIGDAAQYRQQLAQYNDAVQVENAIAARVATSDAYLKGAVSGLKSTQQFTKEAEKDTSWLPKGIIQSYLNGDFGKKTYVQKKDDNGNLMFDKNGQPIYKMHQVKKLDENGKQIYTEEPIKDTKGNPIKDANGNIQTKKVYQYEDKPVEKYPSQAKHALGYYLMDTIGNMLTNASGYMPNRTANPTSSAWKKLQEEKASSYQKALNESRAAGVKKNADAVASFGQHNVDVLNKLDDMGIDTSKLRATKQINTDQTYELEALANAGTYMDKLDSATKNALFDAMIMTSDNIDQATAAILKKSYVTGPLKEFINSVITTGGTLLESFTGLINKLNSVLDKTDQIDISRAGKANAAGTMVKDTVGITKNDIQNYHDNLNYTEVPKIKSLKDNISKEKAKKSPDTKKIQKWNNDLSTYIGLFNKDLQKYQNAYKEYYGKDPDISEWSWITGDEK